MAQHKNWSKNKITNKILKWTEELCLREEIKKWSSISEN